MSDSKTFVHLPRHWPFEGVPVITNSETTFASTAPIIRPKHASPASPPAQSTTPMTPRIIRDRWHPPSTSLRPTPVQASRRTRQLRLRAACSMLASTTRPPPSSRRGASRPLASRGACFRSPARRLRRPVDTHRVPKSVASLQRRWPFLQQSATNPESRKLSQQPLPTIKWSSRLILSNRSAS